MLDPGRESSALLQGHECLQGQELGCWSQGCLCFTTRAWQPVAVVLAEVTQQCHSPLLLL